MITDWPKKVDRRRGGQQRFWRNPKKESVKTLHILSDILGKRSDGGEGTRTATRRLGYCRRRPGSGDWRPKIAAEFDALRRKRKTCGGAAEERSRPGGA